MSDEDIREFRGSDVAMIFQDPMTSLNPVLKVGFQVEEAMAAHRRFNSKQSHDRVVPMLQRVRIPAAAQRVNDFPHQFSGGMRQRVMIAMGLSNEPSLLIADEPTTALDVTVQASIIELLRDLNREMGAAVILITHNLSVVASLCQRVIVNVCRPHRRRRTDARDLQEPAAPVHVVTAAVAAARGRKGSSQAAVDLRLAAGPVQHAARVQVPPPLQVSNRQVLRRRA
jgi:ABC-type microcin C transport system duplicated ATPase subunit YejF